MHLVSLSIHSFWVKKFHQSISVLLIASLLAGLLPPPLVASLVDTVLPEATAQSVAALLPKTGTALAATVVASDTFSSAVYTGGSGWSGDWIESDAAQSATAGNVLITAGELRLAGTNSVSRTVNMANVASATLSLSYRKVASAANTSVVEICSDSSFSNCQTVVTTTTVAAIASTPVTVTVAADKLTANTVLRTRISGYTTAQFFYIDNVLLTPSAPGLIEGVVFNDVNFNGKQDAGEPLLANIDVRAVDSNGTVATATTNANGSYTILTAAGLTGTARVEFTLPSDGSLNAFKPTVAGNTTVQFVNLLNGAKADVGFLSPGASPPLEIGNRIWYDADGDGVQDPNEPPLAGVQVTLQGITGTLATVTTDANGLYLFSGYSGTTSASKAYSLTLATNSNYTISVPTIVYSGTQALGLTSANSDGGINGDLHDSDASQANGTIIVATLGAGSNNHTYDIGYEPPDPSAISVSKVVQTSDGSPVPALAGGFSITVNCPGQAGFPSTQTLNDGQSVTFSNLPVGTVCTVSENVSTLPAAPTGYVWGALQINAPSVTVLNAVTATLAVKNILAPVTPITGSLTLTKTVVGSSRSNYTVSVTGPSYPSGQNFAITTGSNTITNLLAGTYTVTELSPGAGWSTTYVVSGTSSTSNAVVTMTNVITAALVAPGQITGTVYADFDENGNRSTLEPGVGSVLVTAYDRNGNAVGSTTSNVSGTFVFTPTASGPWRLEYTNLPTGYKPSRVYNGTQNGTSTQFVNSLPITGGLYFGVNNPLDYSQSNPSLMVPLYINGDTNTTAPTDALVKFDYNASVTTPAWTTMATKAQIGTTWGLAYARSSKMLYASAFLKRHVGMGPGGLGAIYAINTSGGTPTLFADLAALGANVGTVLSNSARSLGLPTAPSNDPTTFDQIGKVGLGDIDISTDERTLYVVSLNDQTLYALNLPAGTLAGSYAIPDPGCTGGAWRPFALKFKQGALYVGGVCDAQSSQNRANMQAYVYRFSPGANTFTQVLTFPLNYAKGPATGPGGSLDFSGWYPWLGTFDTGLIDTSVQAGIVAVYPQPILSDIEIDVDGSLILGFMDRFGNQGGDQNYGTTGTTMYDALVGGDILRACLNSLGNFVLESAGACGGVTGGGANAQGPGGGEFYNGERFLTSSSETAMGALALKPGSGEVVLTVMDPLNYITGGVSWFSNRNGSVLDRYQIYGPTRKIYAGKANGLGDLELLVDLAPLEIGNRVWNDVNNNGVQDPGEPALAGVVVTLQTPVGSITTTTNISGTYYFTREATTGAYSTTLRANTAYTITINPNQTALTGYGLTLANTQAISGSTTSNDAILDTRDSDAIVVGGLATIYYTTGSDGDNNHGLDFGFTPRPQTSMSITNTAPPSLQIVKDVVGGTVGDAFPVTLFGPGGTVTPTTVTAGTPTRFENIAPGVYTVTEGTLPAAPAGYTWGTPFYVPSNGTVNVVGGTFAEIKIVNILSKIDPLTGTLTLTKTVVGSPRSDYTVTVTGPSYPNGQNFAISTGSNTITNLLMGTYTVTELSPGAGWSTTYVVSGTTSTSIAVVTMTNVITAALVTPGQIAGTVYADFNADGNKSVAETGVQSVTVTAYDRNNTAVGSTTTNITGTWALTPTAAGPWRIEYTNLPAGYEPSRVAAGTQNGTSVQFVNSLPIAGGLYFGVNHPTDYSQANPQMATSTYINGDTNTTAPNGTVVGFSYNDSGTSPVPSTLASKVQVGSTWGLAYARSSKMLYAAAFLKRHVGMGANGPGAIYAIPAAGGTPVLFADMTVLGVNVGTVLSNSARGLGAPGSPSNDPTTFDQIGKVGLGDLDISEDESKLYAVNLNDNRLYILNIGSPSGPGTVVGSYAIPDPGCTGGAWRPFGLKTYRGNVYVGGVCDAQTSQSTNNLRAVVYRFDGSTFTNILDFPLNYTKGQATSGCATSTYTNWHPWTATLITCGVGGDGNPVVVYPQPILSDIEFDVDGSMVVGFIDRSGHQVGNNNYGTTGTTAMGVRNSGDILRACNVSGNLVLQGNAGCPNKVNNNQGPGGGEYYFGEFYWGHYETSSGGLALLPGRGQVVTTGMDPTIIESGGIYWLNNNTGDRDKTYQVYVTASGSPVTFGKGTGMGDVELLSDPAPMEIGNRVWSDVNGNGVQDPGEPGIAGVVVNMQTVSGTITTTTNISGTYYFTREATTGAYSTTLRLNTQYTITINPNQAALTGYALTQANTQAISGSTTSNHAILDTRDSDAYQVNNIPSIYYTTGSAGQNNHGLDFGFTPQPKTSMSITNTSPPSLQIIKELVGGIITDSFPVTVNGPSGFISNTVIVPGTSLLFENVAAGVYTVTEGALPPPPTGYTWGAPLYVTNSVVTVQAGQLAVVKIVNVLSEIIEPITGTLSLTKSVIGSSRTAFSITLTGPSYPAGQIFDISSGSNSIPNLLVGVYTITESSPGEGWTITHTVGAINSSVNGVVTMTNPITAALVAAARITGTVYADANVDGNRLASEAGVAGVTVTAYDRTGAAVGVTTTNASGIYSMTPSAAGPWRLEFTNLPTGYEPSRVYTGTQNGTSSQFVITAPVANLNFAIVSPTITTTLAVELGNRIWNDLNNDGLQTAGEAGLAGVVVSLQTVSGTVTATTNISGTYLFTREAASGAYSRTLRANTPYTITIDPNQSALAGYHLSPANQQAISGSTTGNDALLDTRDSDAYQIVGIPTLYYVTSGGVDSNHGLDVGFTRNPQTSMSITNTAPATLQLIKEFVGGFTSDVFSVTLYGPGGIISPTTVTAGTPTIFENIPAGTYSVTEGTLPTPPAGYEWGTPFYVPATGSAAVQAGTLAEIKLVNILSKIVEPVTGTLTLTKSVLGADIGSYEVTLDGPSYPGGQLFTIISGTNTITNLLPGVYTVTESSPSAGWVTTYTVGTTNFADSAVVTMTSPITVGLVAAARITGTVYADSNVDGNRLASEVGVAGVTVTAYDRTGAAVGFTTTNASGIYSLTPTAGGPWRLEFSNLPAGYQPSRVYTGTQNGTSSQFVISAPVANLNFAIISPTITTTVGIDIGNRVWNDLDNDGIQDAGEPGLSGVVVSLQTVSGTITATTNVSGTYLFTREAATGAYSRTLRANTVYSITIDPTQPALSAYALSFANQQALAGASTSSNHPLSDTRDSDAYLINSIPTIYYATGSTGGGNHGLDFGFSPNPQTGMSIANYAPPALRIIKDIVGGSSTDSFPVTVFGPGGTVINTSVTTGTPTLLENIPAGTYTVTEGTLPAAPAGYEWVDAISYVPSGGVIDADLGEIVEVKIVNILSKIIEPITGSLTLTKSVVGSGLTDYEITLTGPSYPSGQTINIISGTNTITNLLPGVYTVVETTPGTGWVTTYTVSTTVSVDSAVISMTNPITATGFAPVQITGTVYSDYNSDGNITANGVVTDTGVQSVTVTIYDNLGNFTSTVSSANGRYTITPSFNGPYRVEFTTLPTGYEPSRVFTGTQNGTSTQFVLTNTVAARTLNFGVSEPCDYCQNNPTLVVPIYRNGDPLGGGTSGTQVNSYGIAYNASGAAPTVSSISTHANTGAVWGQAYQRETKQLLRSAVVRRHDGLGNGGIAAIYRTDMSGGTPSTSLWVDLESLGVDFGSIPSNSARGLTAVVTAVNTDTQAFPLVGKAGIGGIDLSSDGETLYVMNLFDRKLYRATIGNPLSAPTSLSEVGTTPWLTSNPCSNGEPRPWAVKQYRDKIYAGIVCSAENEANVSTTFSPTFASLQAYVYVYTPSSNNWSQTLTVPLNFQKGETNSLRHSTTDVWWLAWTDNYVADTIVTQNGGISAGATFMKDTNRVSRPMAVLSDLAFDTNGNMILGFMDRGGMMMGWDNLEPDFVGTPTAATPLIQYNISGDILRACGNVSSGWTLEQAGVCGGVTGGGANGQGTLNGEFYSGDVFNAGGGGVIHNETMNGALATLPGTNDVASAAMDPFAVDSGGVYWLSNLNGSKTRAAQLYAESGDFLGNTTVTNGSFGKAGAMGDIAILCDPAPIEIGNRVWNDLDNDGVQEPGEPALAGVVVSLTTPAGTITTTTNISGTYYFTREATSGAYATTLRPNTAYLISINPNQTALSGYSLTLANQQAISGDPASNDAILDTRDSDGILVNNIPSIYYTTGSAGQNNHGLDFGFSKPANGAMNITNVAPASLQIIKMVMGGNSSETFTVTVTGPNDYSVITTVTSSEVRVLSDLVAGTYNVVESGLPEAPSGKIWAAVQTTPNDGSITLQNASTGIFTVTNYLADVSTPVTGSLTLTKSVLGSVRNSFQITLTGPSYPTGQVINIISGTNTITNLTPGIYTITEVSPGNGWVTTYTVGTITNTTSAVISLTNSITAAVVTADRITGTVYADSNLDGNRLASELGVAGVLVTAYDRTGAAVGVTTTNASGVYSLTPSASGPWRLEFSNLPAGYEPSRVYTGTQNGTTQQFVLSAPIANVNLAIISPTITTTVAVEIGNRVWWDQNGDGVQDAGEPALADVPVTLTWAGGSIATTTNITGSYIFTREAATGIFSRTLATNKAYTIQFGTPAGYILTQANATALSGGSATSNDIISDVRDSDAYLVNGVPTIYYTTGNVGERNHGLDVGFSKTFSGSANIANHYVLPPAQFGDRVWIESDGDGLAATGTITPVQGLLITATDGTTIYTTTTTSDGYYSFTVPAGTYVVTYGSVPPAYGAVEPSTVVSSSFESGNAGSYQQSGNPDANHPQDTTVTVADGESNWLIDFAFNPILPAQFGDRVWIESDTDGLAATGTITPVNGMEIYATDGTNYYTATTNSLGYYSFTVPAGTYVVTYGSVPPAYGAVEPSTVVSGSFESGNAGSYQQAGNPDANHDQNTTVTVGQGEANWLIDFAFNPILPAQFGDRVWIESDGDGLAATGTITPVNGMTITATDGISTFVTTTDAQGYYSFSVPAGTYTVTYGSVPPSYGNVAPSTVVSGSSESGNAGTYQESSNPDANHPQDTTVTVGQGEANWLIDFAFTPTVQRFGDRLWLESDSDGDATTNFIGPVANKLITATNASGTPYTTLTDNNGYYTFSVPAGTYTVTYGLPPTGYQPSSTPGGSAVNAASGGNDTSHVNSTVVTLNPSEIITTVDFGFNPILPAQFGDRVWIESDGDGLASTGTITPVNGLTITATDGISTFVTTTNAQGYYSFSVPAGTYTVTYGSVPPSYGNVIPSTVVSGTNESGNAGSYQEAGFPDGNHGQNTVVTVAAGEANWLIDFAFTPTVQRFGDRLWLESDSDGDATTNFVGPVVNKVITATDQQGTVYTTTTDNNGFYTFTVPAGTYTVTYGLPPSGYQPSSTPGGSVVNASSGGNNTSHENGTVVTLNPSEVITTVDFGFNPILPAQFGDRVWIEAVGNGVIGSGETITPVAGMVITATDGSNTYTETTNSDGYYSFTVPAGTYTVTYGSVPVVYGNVIPSTVVSGTSESGNAGSYQQAGNPDANHGQNTTVTVAAGEANWLIDFAFTPIVQRFGDRLWLESDNDGDATTNFIGPVANKLITATDQSGMVYTTTTDNNGYYTFTVPAGTYTVTYGLPPSGYQPSSTPGGGVVNASSGGNDTSHTNNTVVTLNPSEVIITVDFGFTPIPAQFGDRVWIENDGDGLASSGTITPVQGMTITATDGSNTYTATTGSDGYYSFTVPAGTYTVTYGSVPATYGNVVPSTVVSGTSASGNAGSYQQAGNPDANHGQNTVVTVAAGEANWHVDFAFTPTVQRFGDRLWLESDSDGIAATNFIGPVANKLITATSSNGTVYTTTTDNNGLYTFTVPAGTYTVTYGLPPSGYQPSSTPGGSAVNASSGGNDTSHANETVVTLNPSEVITTVDFGFNSILPAQFGDRVWIESDTDGLAATGTITPVQGMELYATDGTTYYTATTNSQGYYSFTVPAGTYTVTYGSVPVVYGNVIPSTVVSGTSESGNAGSYQQAGNPDANHGQDTTVTVGQGEANWRIDFAFTPTVQRFGDRLWLESDSDGNATTNFVGPVANKLITATSSTGTVYTTTTDNNGFYTFTVPAGTYTVTYGLPPSGYQPSSTPGGSVVNASSGGNNTSHTNNTVVTLNPSEVITTVDFGFNPILPAQFGDRVWIESDTDGLAVTGMITPVNGMEIYANNGTNYYTATTNSQGYYSFTVPAETYTVTYGSVPVVYGNVIPSTVVSGTSESGNAGSYQQAGNPDANHGQDTTVTVGQGEANWRLDFAFNPPQPTIVAKKYTNGFDADTTSGPILVPGSVVTWTYEISNTGNVTLTNVALADDREGSVSCPQNQLAPGAGMTCVITGTAVAGQYTNTAIVTGTPPSGVPVTSTNPSHYFAPDPDIDLRKYTNGYDADALPGPYIAAGQTVTWTYVVSNTGNVSLTIAAGDLHDDKVGAINNVPITLQVGEVVTLTKTGIATVGQYTNTGIVTGTPPSFPPLVPDLPGFPPITPTVPPPTSTNPSHYFAPEPDIDLRKYTNGYDADVVPGPVILVGDPITWTYVVSNTGNVPLTVTAGSLVDDIEGVINNSEFVLQPNERTVLTKTGIATLGQYANTGIVTGTPPVPPVGPPDIPGFPPVPPPMTPPTSTNPSHYDGVDLSLGNRVWFDTNNDGTHAGSEVGVAGVRLTLLDGIGNPVIRAATGLPITTTTDSNGYYTFTQLVSATYSVRVDSSNFQVGASLANYVNSDFTEASADNNVDTRDNGINPVTLAAYLSNGVVSGPIVLIVNSEPIGEDHLGSADSSDDSNFTVDFGFYQLTLGNLVWEDTNNDGQKQPGESPLPAVIVRLLDIMGNAILGSNGQPLVTQTDSSGYYTFTGLLSGAYIVEIAPTPLYRSSTSHESDPNLNDDNNDNGVITLRTGTIRSAPLFLMPGDIGAANNNLIDNAIGSTANPTIDFGLWQPASLGDRVWLDVDKDGVQDEGEVGVPGVKVELRDANGTVITTTTTDGNGNYQFSSLIPGEYSVKFTAPPGYALTIPDRAGDDTKDSDANMLTGETIKTTLVSGENDPTWDAGIYPLLSLGNLVWYDKNNDGLRQPGERGIAEVVVQLFKAGDDPNSAVPLLTTTTDLHGYYLFTALTPGSYFVYLPKPPVPGALWAPLSSQPTDSNDNGEDNDDNGTQTLPGQPVISPIVVLVPNSESISDGDTNPDSELTIDFGFTQLASLGDYVWLDTDKDGVQDGKESLGANGQHAGVPGVQVILHRADGTVVATTHTDSNGYYEFNDLIPGAYYVEFKIPPGYGVSPQNVVGHHGARDDSFDSDADPVTGNTAVVTLVAGEHNPTLDLGLTLPNPPASIGDRVWYDGNKDGVQDPSESGIPGVIVTLYRVDGSVVATITTDAKGGYLFENLPVGNYYVGFTPPPGYKPSPQNQGGDDGKDSDADPVTGKTIVVTLQAGKHDPRWDAGFYLETAPAALGDYVWYDLDVDGVQDANESGVPGVTVRLYDANGNLLAETVTGSDGRYLFNNLAPGQYMVEFEPPVGYVLTEQNQGLAVPLDSDADLNTGRTVLITLTPGQVDLSWDAGLYLPVEGGTGAQPPSSLGNYVWFDKDADGVQEPGEPSIANVVVKLYNQAGELLATTETDANGLYLFPNLPPGSYYVVFILPEGMVVSPMGSDPNSNSDSNPDPATGETPLIILEVGEGDLSIDAGVYQPPTALEGTEEPTALEEGDEPTMLKKVYLPVIER